MKIWPNALNIRQLKIMKLSVKMLPIGRGTFYAQHDHTFCKNVTMIRYMHYFEKKLDGKRISVKSYIESNPNVVISKKSIFFTSYLR